MNQNVCCECKKTTELDSKEGHLFFSAGMFRWACSAPCMNRFKFNNRDKDNKDERIESTRGEQF